MRRTGFMAAVVVTVLVAVAAASAEAKTVVRLPLGSHFTDLAVAPNGQAWVSADAGLSGRWGAVSAGERPRWQTYPIAGGFIGLLSARSDGGAWMLADRRTVLRIGADGTAATFGGLDVPLVDDSLDDPFAVGVTASDDAFVLAGPPGRFLRVAPDGTATAKKLRVPRAPRNPRDCIYVDMDAAADGAVVVADYRCWRLVTFTSSGAASVVDLRPRRSGGRRYVTGVLVHPDGALWFSAYALKGAKVRSVIGRVAPDGRVTLLTTPSVVRGLAGIVAAPDGAIWAPAWGACTLYRVRNGRLERFNAPFPVHELAFAPDGSAWLRGYSRLAHLSATELTSSRAPRRCDTTMPRTSFPRVKDYTISIRALRRSGLRLKASERGTLSGYANFVDEQVYLHRTIRKAGGTTTVRFPTDVLDRLEHRIAAGEHVELYFNPTFSDPSGNGWIHPGPFRLVR